MTSFSAMDSNELSLFDPENLHHLELLRRTVSVSPATTTRACPAEETLERIATPEAEVDRVFDRYRILANDKHWQVGTVDIDIIHRGRMRIATHEWPPLITYGKHDIIENGIVKQFRLNVLQHADDIRLIYGTYRFRLQVAKAWANDYRCGKLLDARANIRESMINLAYWLTAQPHAQTNYSMWELLIEEAISKLRAANYES